MVVTSKSVPHSVQVMTSPSSTSSSSISKLFSHSGQYSICPPFGCLTFMIARLYIYCLPAHRSRGVLHEGGDSKRCPARASPDGTEFHQYKFLGISVHAKGEGFSVVLEVNLLQHVPIRCRLASDHIILCHLVIIRMQRCGNRDHSLSVADKVHSHARTGLLPLDFVVSGTDTLALDHNRGSNIY